MAAKAPTVRVPNDDDEIGSSAAVIKEAQAKSGPIGMPDTVRIVLDETDNMAPTGAPFSLNGKAYLIRPGEAVDIPLGILEVIDNAVMEVPIHDPQTLKVIGYRKRHRFPYRTLRPGQAA